MKKCNCHGEKDNNQLKKWLNTHFAYATQDSLDKIDLIREYIRELHLYWHFWSEQEDEARFKHNQLVRRIASKLPVPLPSEEECQKLAWLHNDVQHMRNLSCHRLHLRKWIMECLNEV